jgi:hypothetical protein
MLMLPDTTTRVTRNTAERINEQIRRETEARVAHTAAAGPAAIGQRLAELDREWDIEHMLEANAASARLILAEADSQPYNAL